MCHRQRKRSGSDWWIHGVLPLGILHLALYGALQARPGRVGVTLWTFGPPLLVVAGAALLAGALIGAFWGRHSWSWRRAGGVAALGALVSATALYRTYPSSHDGFPSRVEFRLPLDGPVTVAWGGSTSAANHHVNVPAERWAYDLLVTAQGVSHRGDGTELTDYFVYGRPVRAPATGRVVSVRDGAPDVPPRQPDPTRGNDIVIEVAPGQYLVIAHLKASTLDVAPGQLVSQGAVVGLVGNSGNSTEPHVHLQLEDSPVPGAGEGIPFRFSRYTTGDGQTVTSGMPQGGIRHGRFTGDVVTTISSGEDQYDKAP